MNAYEDLAIERLFRLDGDVAFITGAGSGFGRIAALALARAGASVAATDKDLATVEAVVREISDGGGRAIAMELDVSKRADIKTAIDEAAAAFGGLHILINNAGITRRGPTEDATDEDWDAVVEVNMTAAFAGARAAAPHMFPHGNGRIVNISSIVGLVGNRLFPHLSYQTTKGALVNMTRGLAVEWASRGIRVNAIAPTFFRTNFGAAYMQSNPELFARIEEQTPMGRLGEPWELAGGLLYLSSRASSMVTGVTLPIDGGWTAV